MRLIVFLASVAVTLPTGRAVAQLTASVVPPTPAAELTRSKALKAKVSVDYQNVRLGDVLKEFAAQADMGSDMLIMWAYGPGFPYAQKVTYACRNKPIEAALGELLGKAGGLGYVVVSKAGDKRDGWVLLTATGERGTERGPATPEEEKEAAARLSLAKKLIDTGKSDAAKPVLTIVAQRYANTKVAAEARELLAKLTK